MPPYIFDITLWLSLLPIPALVAFFSFIVFICLRLKGHTVVTAAPIVLPLAAFLMMGLIAGYLTGISRESAVGAVLPAVLSLLGAAAALLIGRARDPAVATRVSGLILLFSLGLFLGSTWGSAMRQASVDFDLSENEQIRRSHVELKVREFREAIGLPPEIAGDKPAAQKRAEK